LRLFAENVSRGEEGVRIRMDCNRLTIDSFEAPMYLQ